jgi:hypothetical protein
MISSTAKQFLSLLEQFVEEDLSEATFSKKYLALFKDQDRPNLSESEFRPIENVFFALDEYHPDPELSQIPEKQFQAEVHEALEQLRALDEETSAGTSTS